MRIFNLEAAEICSYILIKTTYWRFITTKMKLMLSVPSVCSSNICVLFFFFFSLNSFLHGAYFLIVAMVF